MKSSVPSLLAATGIALLSTSTNAQIAIVPRRALRGLEVADSDYQWADEFPKSLPMSMHIGTADWSEGPSNSPPFPSSMTSDISFIVANSETAAGSPQKGEAAKPPGQSRKSGKAKKKSVVKRRGLEVADSDYQWADEFPKSLPMSMHIGTADWSEGPSNSPPFPSSMTSDISFIVANSETAAVAPQKGEAAKPPGQSTKSDTAKKNGVKRQSKAAKSPGD
mmetsp:Transcript_15672/g.28427  ORF Transcript_15672/g.28427 Transcript_15672/m.28427 type:complete len:221 (+) Transcript_15672:55-717(+)